MQKLQVQFAKGRAIYRTLEDFQKFVDSPRLELTKSMGLEAFAKQMKINIARLMDADGDGTFSQSIIAPSKESKLILLYVELSMYA